MYETSYHTIQQKHQMAPFANPKMHWGRPQRVSFTIGIEQAWEQQQLKPDLVVELPSYFMDRTPHRIIKCTFKQHTDRGWVVMCA